MLPERTPPQLGFRVARDALPGRIEPHHIALRIKGHDDGVGRIDDVAGEVPLSLHFKLGPHPLAHIQHIGDDCLAVLIDRVRHSDLAPDRRAVQWPEDQLLGVLEGALRFTATHELGPEEIRVIGLEEVPQRLAEHVILQTARHLREPQIAVHQMTVLLNHDAGRRALGQRLELLHTLLQLPPCPLVLKQQDVRPPQRLLHVPQRDVNEAANCNVYQQARGARCRKVRQDVRALGEIHPREREHQHTPEAGDDPRPTANQHLPQHNDHQVTRREHHDFLGHHYAHRHDRPRRQGANQQPRCRLVLLAPRKQLNTHYRHRQQHGQPQIHPIHARVIRRADQQHNVGDGNQAHQGQKAHRHSSQQPHTLFRKGSCCYHVPSIPALMPS